MNVRPLNIRRGARLGAVIAAVALFASCGGGDDDDEGAVAATVADDAGEPATTTPAAADDGDDDDAADDVPDIADDDGEVIEVDDIDDIPEQCREAFADFLRTIEPAVSDIDWENATMSDFESVSDALETEMSSIEQELDEECSQYELTDDAGSIEAMIEFARDEAPGAVGYLEFLQRLMADFSGMDPGEAPADLPDDCAGLKAYIEDLMSEHDSMSQMPLDDLMNVSAAMGEISDKCTVDEASEFFNRDDVTEFMSG